MNKHVFIITPAYSGKVDVSYSISLMETYNLLKNHGVEVSIQIEPSGSLLVTSRNRLMELFFQSNATHVLCIDSDLGWAPQAVLAMLDVDKDFVVGVYPSRLEQGFMFRPVYNKESRSLITDKHLIQMEAVPAGFMLIKREVIQKMRDDNPQLYYSPKDPRCNTENTFALFNTELFDGEFWGEDYVFCKRAIESGFEIWADPLIQFNHAGRIGSLAEILTSK